MTKSTRKTRTKKTSPKLAHLPFEAAMLGKLLAGTDADTQRAFAVARAALAKHHASSELEYYDLTDELDPHVMAVATTDVFAKSVKRVLAFDRATSKAISLMRLPCPHTCSAWRRRSWCAERSMTSWAVRDESPEG